MHRSPSLLEFIYLHAQAYETALPDTAKRIHKVDTFFTPKNVSHIRSVASFAASADTSVIDSTVPIRLRKL